MSHLPVPGSTPALPPAPNDGLPRPLAWAIAICLVAFAIIAVLAVAVLAGFTPHDVLTLVEDVTKAISSTKS